MTKNILIVLDTLRKDFSDKYIHPTVKKYGFYTYDNAISTAPWTLPSHVSMLTGKYPYHHGIHLSKKSPVPFGLRIKEELRRTMLHKHLGKSFAITANIMVSNYYGFGFDKYVEIQSAQDIPERFNFIRGDGLERLKKYRSHYRGKIKLIFDLIKNREFDLLVRGGLTVFFDTIFTLSYKLRHPLWPKDKGVSDIINYIKNHDIESYNFVLINLIEVHEPYSVFRLLKSDWPEKYREFTKYLAEKLDELLSYLNIKEGDKIVITSDHGQLLGEFGLYGHGHYLYDELIRVPLYSSEEIVHNNHWFSLKNLYYFFLGKNIPEEEYVFSEYYGVYPHDSVLLPKHRIAVYGKEGKAVYSVDDKRLEVVEGIDGDVAKAVVKKFLSTGINVKHLIPKKRGS